MYNNFNLDEILGEFIDVEEEKVEEEEELVLEVDEDFRHETEGLINNEEVEVEGELQYPALIIKGVKFNFEIDIIKDMESKGDYIVYVEVGDVIKEICETNLTLDKISRLYSIRDYDIELKVDEEKSLCIKEVMKTMLM